MCTGMYLGSYSGELWGKGPTVWNEMRLAWRLQQESYPPYLLQLAPKNRVSELCSSFMQHLNPINLTAEKRMCHNMSALDYALDVHSSLSYLASIVCMKVLFYVERGEKLHIFWRPNGSPFVQTISTYSNTPARANGHDRSCTAPGRESGFVIRSEFSL